MSPDGRRLTTLEVTFPRFILAEVNTHRMLSRNSASSRAIPPEKQIDRVVNDPFVPETFNRRVKGMGVGDALVGAEADAARTHWLAARDHAVFCAEKLLKLDCDKSRINRLLEPFMWHTAIISATEWSNFFGLRNHPAAQPEFQIVAQLMREAMNDSVKDIQQLDYDQWHLPLITREELAQLCAMREGLSPTERFEPKSLDQWITEYKLVSVRRCARVSFDRHTDTEPWEKSIEQARKLMTNGHLSPFEHVARPFNSGQWARIRRIQEAERKRLELAQVVPANQIDLMLDSMEFVGNFRGWVQYRKEIPYESDFDALVKSQEY